MALSSGWNQELKALFWKGLILRGNWPLKVSGQLGQKGEEEIEAERNEEHRMGEEK